jgi:hypothetical protein
MRERRVAVRVSDADREVAVEVLREHYFAGRLDVDEFTERVEQAYAARSAAELDDVTRELPEEARAAPARRKPWLFPGNESFAVRIHVPKPPEQAIDEIVGDIFMPLAGTGYKPREEDSTRRVFARTHRPPWTILVAVLLFPFGLIALMYREVSQVVVNAASAEHGLTAVEVYGTAPLAVRRVVRDRVMQPTN